MAAMLLPCGVAAGAAMRFVGAAKAAKLSCAPPWSSSRRRPGSRLRIRGVWCSKAKSGGGLR